MSQYIVKRREARPFSVRFIWAFPVQEIQKWKRRANSMGVIVSPSIRWITKYSTAGSKAYHKVFTVSRPASVNDTNHWPEDRDVIEQEGDRDLPASERCEAI